jgi:hypothetical protein
VESLELAAQSGERLVARRLGGGRMGALELPPRQLALRAARHRMLQHPADERLRRQVTGEDEAEKWRGEV